MIVISRTLFFALLIGMFALAAVIAYRERKVHDSG